MLIDALTVLYNIILKGNNKHVLLQQAHIWRKYTGIIIENLTNDTCSIKLLLFL